MEVKANDPWILKYKSLGWPDQKIADKMGMPVAEVRVAWERLCKMVREGEPCGHFDLIQMFQMMSKQFQILGESLNIVTRAIGRQVSAAKLQELIGPDPKASAEAISRRYIVLEPFVMQSPEKALKETIQSN